MSKRAVDFSLFTGDVIQSEVDCWKSNGIERMIVGYSVTGSFEQALSHSAGLERHAYIGRFKDRNQVLRKPEELPIWTEDAIRRAHGNLDFIWLDWESGPFSAQATRDAIAICEGNNIASGIYTADWYWVPTAGNTDEFSYRPLWEAEGLSANEPHWPTSVDGAGTSQPFTPFGGWDFRLMWQWRLDVVLCGHSVDLNIYDELVTPKFWQWEGER
jgi:hypothetical protein